MTRLAEDYLHDYGKVREFFDGDFRDEAAFERQAARAISRPLPRRELAAVLREQNRAYGGGPRTFENIEALEREQGRAVVTGQQAGLFSGPLYTVYKALTAVKLADRLNGRTGGTIVPVFWIASDDHDLAEINRLVFLDKDNRIEEISCSMPTPEAKFPISRLLLPPDITDGLRRMAELTPESEFKGEILSGLEEAYRPGRGWAEAFGRWMSRLFASRGLVFIDAADPRLKRLGGDVFGREIAAGSAATPPALAASRKLEAAGYDSQVVLREGILQLFYAERQRRSIKWDGRAFEIQEPPEAISKDELLALAREKPFRFSPGVLLRPIYQDALLPTVAYVGGPAEIAYFAQMKGVYERFGLPMPVVYPRMTLTVVEKNVGRILEKFGLAVADLRNGAEGIIRQIGESGIPESLAGALRLASADVERDFEALAREVAAFDPTLTESARLARGRTARQIRFLEEKVLRSAKKRDGIAVAQIRKAADHLYPCGRPQERIFNVVPLLLKYGPSLIDWLDEEADLDAHDHQILRRRS